MYRSTYINVQNLSPTLLWVWKFDLKLGCWPLTFKITISTWFFQNHAKSKAFQKHRQPQPFFRKFDENFQNLDKTFPFGKMAAKPPERVLKKMAAKPPELPPEPVFKKCRPSRYNLPPGSKDKIYTASAKREFDGMDGMGWDGRKSKWVLQICVYFMGT